MLVPSETASWNVTLVFVRPSGAVNVGAVEWTSLRETDGPAVCVHVYVSDWPSGSMPEPASVTTSFSLTV